MYRFEIRGISSGTDSAFPANHQHPIVAMVKAASFRGARTSLLRSLMSHGWRDARVVQVSAVPQRPQAGDANERWLLATAKSLGFAMIVDCRAIDEPFALNIDLKL